MYVLGSIKFLSIKFYLSVTLHGLKACEDIWIGVLHSAMRAGLVIVRKQQEKFIKDASEGF